ncbi:hypothetical protein JX266_004138 [Neoarthrinium moseri]|nr:hypothetical protein JX266_004138 [Neoarthrinium moseri]
MKLVILSLLAAASDAVLGQVTERPDSDHVTVQTSTGSFTGLIDPKFPNTLQFRAIPFAKPPVLERRWLAPQKLSSSSSEHHYATRFPPSCPQFVTAVTSLWNQNLTKGNLIYNGNQNDSSGLVGEATSEDCLYLAVWMPKRAAAPRADAGLPVLFFMTGGGFVIGGVDIPWQLPPSWVERSQSHIVVTINYRLNIFGFPNARGLEGGDQNLGILDQRAALEWVRDNIAAFGGDPNRITQWGRSAGSISADIHAYAFHEEPIAQAYWLQSGTIFSVSAVADPTYSNFTFVARHVGCDAPSGDDDDEDGAAELDCMRRVPFAQIENFIGQYGDRGETPALSFSLIPDDRIVFTDYEARSEAGKIARLPAIISATANEFSSLVPYPVDNLTAGPYQPAVDAGTISFGVCPTFNSTVYRNRMGADVPVFRFQYAGTFPNLNYYKWLGAYHASDAPIAFGTYRLLDHIANTTTLEIEVSNSMQDHVLAFVKDPYHGPQTAMGWKPMVVSDPHGGDLIRFGANGKVSERVDGVEVDGVCQGIREYNPFP